MLPMRRKLRTHSKKIEVNNLYSNRDICVQKIKVRKSIKNSIFYNFCSERERPRVYP